MIATVVGVVAAAVLVARRRGVVHGDISGADFRLALLRRHRAERETRRRRGVNTRS